MKISKQKLEALAQQNEAIVNNYIEEQPLTATQLLSCLEDHKCPPIKGGGVGKCRCFSGGGVSKMETTDIEDDNLENNCTHPRKRITCMDCGEVSSLEVSESNAGHMSGTGSVIRQYYDKPSHP